MARPALSPDSGGQRGEPAAVGGRCRVRDLAGEHDGLEVVHLGDHGQQRLRVGVPRLEQHLLGRPRLDDPAEVHHRNPVVLDTGFTDSVYLRAAGRTAAYGFNPAWRTPASVIEAGYHNADERIHVDDLLHSVTFHLDLVRRLLG